MIEYKKVDGSFDLSGKSAVVVGGGGGIGGATAEMYAKKGANVAIVDCKDNVEEVAAELAQRFGVRTVGIKCDVTKQSEIENTVQAVVGSLGEIDILANMPRLIATGVAWGLTSSAALGIIAELYEDEGKRGTVNGWYNAVMAALGSVLSLVAGRPGKNV